MLLDNCYLGASLVSVNKQVKAGESREWNWHPNLPVAVSPIFSWPPKPIATLKWFTNYWLPVTESLIYALLAVGVWFFLVPPLEEMRALDWGWVLQIWARNVILMIIFAQGLHLWLYGWKKQKEKFKYDRRSLAKKNRVFLWNDQYWDNVTYTLLSGVTIWTFYDVIVWLGYSNGWAPLITFSDHPIWFFLLFLIMPAIQSFHFYWVHRALHIPWIYKRVHSVHHRSISIGPWSGFSMHPIEVLAYMSLLLIFLIVPAHPIHFLFMGYWLALATATSHSGYEKLVLGDKTHLKIGTFHHQLHHRYFECNYGNTEMPWDNWFGSYHDGSPEATERVKKVRKRMYN